MERRESLRSAVAGLAVSASEASAAPLCRVHPRHLPAALEQMGQTTLMESKLESVVGHPGVIQSMVFNSQVERLISLDRLRLPASRRCRRAVRLRDHESDQPRASANRERSEAVSPRRIVYRI